MLRRGEVRIFYAVADALDPKPDERPARDPLPAAEALLRARPAGGRLAVRVGLVLLEVLGWLLRGRSFAWVDRAGRRRILHVAARVPGLGGAARRVCELAEAGLASARRERGGAGPGP